MLGRGDGIAAGRVDDHDSFFGGRVHVHVVQPHAGAADHLEFFRGFDDFPRQLSA